MSGNEKEIEDYKKILASERAGVEKFGERDKLSEENRQLNIERIRAEKFREWDWTELKFYLRYDYWKAVDGLAVLAGCRYPYGGDTMLDYDEPLHRACPSHGELCANRYAQLCGVWERSKLSDNEERYAECSAPFDREYSPVYFIEWALSKNLRIDWLDWAIERGLYIPKQEAAQPAQTTSAPAYSTHWLTIQNAAIAQFFNPRRNPDAKKEEVIEWINTQAVGAGLGESNNIASTIFTIIKPENHDPKKKRVEPQKTQ